MFANFDRFIIFAKGGAVIYNLVAEFSSLLIFIIAVVGLFTDNSVISPRYKGLKQMYILALITNIATIFTCLTANYYDVVPVFITDFFRTNFFFLSPLLALFYLVFSISIVYDKMDYGEFFKRFYWVFIPYLIYTIIIVTNQFHRLVFEISPELGYIKNSLNRISYLIAFVYLIISLIFIYKHRKSPRKNVLLIVILNFFLSTFIFCIQIFYPFIQTSSLASLSGLLVVHFYVLSVSKSSDPLTELNNRQTLTSNLLHLRNNKARFSLAVFSIRNFKSVNERYGLDVGDSVLQDIAQRLHGILPSRRLYRYSGDEFAYLSIDDSSEQLDSLLRNVNNKLAEPFLVSDNELTLDTIYARVDYPLFGENVKEIISAIDYSISTLKKNSGETNYLYDPTVRDKMKRRHYIIDRLKEAEANDGFEVHYQPIYSRENDNFTMAEALIRLKPSDEPFVSPGEFIPIAEEVGLVSRLTYIVLEKLCRDFRDILDKYGDEFPLKSISINFPYVHFLKRDVADEVCEILNRYNISPSMIKMELTERTLVSDTTATKEIMDDFIKRGFVFELDDFGIEYSNLSMFFNMPVDIIKFDRSLVYATTLDNTRRAFFLHLIKAIKEMDIKVVMEGVEEQELLNYLISCGCDYIQGYVFTKPLLKDEFIDFLLLNKDKSQLK